MTDAELHAQNRSHEILAPCGFGAYGTCCCTCKFHATVKETCIHSGGYGRCGRKMTIKESVSLFVKELVESTFKLQQRKYACTMPYEVDGAPIEINFSEHGMCEMYKSVSVQ